MSLTDVIGRFVGDVCVSSVSPFGNGHINDTYRFNTQDGTAYLLQRLNTGVFRQPEQVQDNICRVTAYLKERIREKGGDPLRETMTPILAVDGKSFVLDEDGAFWRIFLFIEDTRSPEAPAGMEELYETGRAFGIFERRLRTFPAETLYETIPGFHDTPQRTVQLRTAMEKDSARRGKNVQDLYRFCLERMPRVDLFVRAQAEGHIKKRVTHNDTKANNVLLETGSGRGICVCDLDTVMPGFAAYDFGDAIRYGASMACEDESDLSQVALSTAHAKAYAEGFLSEAGDVFPETERRLLPEGIWMITFEQAMRFLTDYLNGDTYYKTMYPEHNLVRARNQIALVQDIERKRKVLMNDLV